MSETKREYKEIIIIQNFSTGTPNVFAYREKIHAQSIAIKKFYQTLVILEEFEATGELHRSVKSLYDRLRRVLDEAKSIWGAKNS